MVTPIEVTSDVEQEVRDVAFFEDVRLALDTQLAGGADGLQRAVQMRPGFGMDADDIGARLDEGRHQRIDRRDHQLDVDGPLAIGPEAGDAARFARFKPTAIYYNIGRGTTNDESAMEAALRTQTIAAAYIDAFAEEPLPPAHPLWTTPNCFITPHTAGGHETEAERHVEMFLENLNRLQRGDELIDRIM